MKVFITGATGFIGNHLTEKLSRQGHDITVLVRNKCNAPQFSRNCNRVIEGDIFSHEALEKGMDGCDWVFHLAAYAAPTSLDPGIPYKTNVEGTVNVLDAALKQKIKRVVVTSTAGTMGYSGDGKPVGEETNKNLVYDTEYERTKFRAEMIATEYSRDIDVIVVNPSRVFGPGKLSKSNSVTRMIKMYGQGIWRIIPGDGTSIGNYAFIDDVVDGHILAALHGKPGERYILGGENVTFDRFFETLGSVFGKRRRMLRINSSGLKRLAGVISIPGKIAGRPPVIADEWIDKYLKNWILSSDKAIKELSYKITPFGESVERTVAWLKTKNGNE
jgi:nucleoside-diphosphate-sugar epimerase